MLRQVNCHSKNSQRIIKPKPRDNFSFFSDDEGVTLHYHTTSGSISTLNSSCGCCQISNQCDWWEEVSETLNCKLVQWKTCWLDQLQLKETQVPLVGGKVGRLLLWSMPSVAAKPCIHGHQAGYQNAHSSLLGCLLVFTNAVNPEALKNKKRDIAELPVVSRRLIIFTATMPGSLLGAEVPAMGFSTHNHRF